MASTRRPAPSRKRALPGAAPKVNVKTKSEPGLDKVAGALSLEDEEDAGEVSEDEQQEVFPELDLRQDDQDTDHEEISGGESGDSEDSEGDEEGFDSDEIDNWDESKDQMSNDSDLEEGDAALARMIARERSKPNEQPAGVNRLGIPRETASRLYDERRNDDGSLRGKLVRSDITGENKMQYPPIEPSYDSDSSTEETENRIGNVPLHWYDDLPHLGYDVNGKRVLRPAQGDALDKFLDTVEGDGDAWFSARDKLGGKDVRLTDEELDIIQRLQRAEIPLDSYNPYEDATDWFTQHQLTTPLTSRPEPKRRFIPSKWEHKKVMKIVRAIRQGRIVAHAPGKQRPDFYNIWNDSDMARADHPMHMPAPKLPLPSHIESYNPPEEYLFNDEERAEWEAADPEDRKLSFIPKKYTSLRLVPGYDAGIQERFQRCLDLYLAPRVRRQRIDLENPEDLLPKLPSPRELRPFPTHTDVYYNHASRVRTCAPDPSGMWLLTGAEDGYVRLWDTALGRCVSSWDMNFGLAKDDHGPVYSIQWAPTKQYALAAVACAGRVSLLAPPMCATGEQQETNPAVEVASAAFATATGESQSVVRWARPSEAERSAGVCVHVYLSVQRAQKSHALIPKQVRWHGRADYFATVCPDAGPNAVLIHQVSKHRSQAPFRRAKRQSSAAYAVQCVCFHPHRPYLFVATQRYVRIFDLVQQALHKTLQPGVRWISSMDVHPSGDHLIVGSYDRRVLWFDLDWSERPYKTLRYHSKAVRAVSFSPRFPLFATAADDGSVHVYHATVYTDLLQNPLLVPLKVLRGHNIVDSLGVLDIHWHPTLPWLFSAAADSDARLWTP
ncbi:Ribosome biogenesis protein erb1 [Malassezia psittaci]|uniref:Ribosome biogenesis protein ERB1 n=1 Tax=Malassezia psittaci TaxID=1821823 RepID=A0AAF0JC38_9BASI|nr:Ribosome biogenesis protein erb1 [Malassezia psittaci]